MPGSWSMVATAAMLVACGRIGFDHGPGSGPPDSSPPGDSGGPAPSSCVDLPASCGPGGTDSCCAGAPVAGSSYYRSYDVAGDNAFTNMTNLATVSDFVLDRFEITVGRFRAFVEAGQGTRAAPPSSGAGAHAQIAASGWSQAWDARLAADKAALIAAVKCNSTFETWTDAQGANERRPMNCITWYEAMAFCAWDGGYLPTEAEWNLAAAGGAEQRAYPWSSPPGSLTIDGTRASYNNGTTCVGDGMNGCVLSDLVFAGSKPAGNGRWGHSDLAGNVWEWTLDAYAAAYQNPCNDCANLANSATRVVRGGGFGGLGSVTSDLRVANRAFDQAPEDRLPGVGARCARRP